MWGGYLTDEDVTAAVGLLSIEQRSRLAELGVFVTDSPVERDLVWSLWRTTSGLAQDGADRLLGGLTDLSIVVELGADRLLLPTPVRAHCVRLLGPDGLRGVHSALLTVARAALPVGPGDDRGEHQPWWRLPATSGYLSRNLVQHLRAVGRTAEADRLTADLRWILAQIGAGCVDAAEAESARAAEPWVRSLAALLARSGHLLESARRWDLPEPEPNLSGRSRRRCADPGASLGPLLASQVRRVMVSAAGTPGDQAVAGAVDRFTVGLPGPALISRWSAVPWDPTVVRTLSAGLRQRLLSAPDGRLASVGEGGFRVWDLATGRLRVELDGALTVTTPPDLSWAATRDGDGTTRVWDLASGQLRAVLPAEEGHRYPDHAAAPDGSWLAVTEASGSVRIWDAHSGRARAMLPHAGRNLDSDAVAPDGSWLAVTRPGAATLWDPRCGRRIAELDHETPEPVFVELVAPDSSWLVTCARDGTLRLWDARTGDQRARLATDLPWPQGRLAAPDSAWLTVFGSQEPPRVWHSGNGALQATLAGHDGPVIGTVASPDGAWLATVSSDGSIRVWETGVWQVRAVLDGHPGGRAALVVAPDGSWLACSGDRPAVRLWDTTTWSMRAEIHTTDRVENWAVVPDSTWLAGISWSGDIRVWDLARVSTLTPVCRAGADDDTDCVVSPDGAWLAVRSAHRVTVRDRATGGIRWSVSERDPRGPWAPATDGSWLAVADASGVVRVRDAGTGRVRAELVGHAGPVTGCVVGPGGSWLVTVGVDGTVRRWDTSGWRPVDVLFGGARPITGCLLAPDGSFLVCGTDQAVIVWDLVAASVRFTLEGYSLGGATIDPGGRWIGVCAEGRVVLFSALTGEEYNRAGWYGTIRRCVAGPDGTWIGLVGLHATQYGPSVDVFLLRPYADEYGFGIGVDEGAELASGDLVVSPDGRWVATTDGAYGPIRIWDTTTWQAVAATWRDGPVTALGWLPDSAGLWVVGAGGVEVLDLLPSGRSPAR